jgi:hypothetical protein
MDLKCPACGRSIPLDDVNVSTDLALCRACGKSFQFSDLVGASSSCAANLNSPPSGAWYERTPDGFRTGATTRSWFAIFIVPFTCVWAGGSLSGIYGKQILSGKFDPASSLFGLPFLIGSLILICLCAMTVAGKISVTKSGNELSIFTGVGPVGWTRHYSWPDFYTAKEDLVRSNFRMTWSGMGRAIALEGKRKVSFGSMWSEDRRYFVLSAIREMLIASNGARISALSSLRF